MFGLMIIGLIIYIVYRFMNLGKQHRDYSIEKVGREWFVYYHWFGYGPVAKFEDYEEARCYVETEVKRKNK